jgi:competence protein ComEC
MAAGCSSDMPRVRRWSAMKAYSIVISILLAACPAPPPPVAPVRPPTSTADPTIPPDPSLPRAPSITWRKIETAADMPAPPRPGTYHIHMIDVGTGLAIFVRGADFALLYDAGTNDREEKPARVLAYLEAAIGASGDELCVERAAPPGARLRIDHVVLSHPHLDHASALDLVMHCYEVEHFWDSGRINETVFYRELLAGSGRRTTRYHAALGAPPDRTVRVKDLAIKIERWERFSEGDSVRLGEGAQFTILHADPKRGHGPNSSSLVLAVELGGIRLLLVGDAESGPRKDPSHPLGDVEAFLVEQHAPRITADILQVGHHGSMTSSRRGFLEAVRPRLALISSGPKRYGKVTLPDREVLEELGRVGATILRTDERDTGCPVRGRMGGDRGPGGCDSWLVVIESER